MNSVEAYKSFITFLILVGILALSVFGFNLIFRSSNQNAKADTPKQTQTPKDKEPETNKEDSQFTPLNEPKVEIEPTIEQLDNSGFEGVNTEPTVDEPAKTQPVAPIKNNQPSTTDTSPIKESAPEQGSYSGFDDSIEYNSNTMVLGKTTNKISQNQIDEFKIAMKFQDTRYDFNKDAIIDMKDYPLYISFINSSED